MGSLLYLISIFSAYDMNLNNSYLSQPVIGEEQAIEVEFSAMPHVSVGDPVLYKGELVGSVYKVNLGNQAGSGLNYAPSIVSIKISNNNFLLVGDVIGLVAKIKAPFNPDSKPSVRSALELIQVSSEQRFEKFQGFNSFEEFWNSSLKLMPVS